MQGLGGGCKEGEQEGKVIRRMIDSCNKEGYQMVSLDSTCFKGIEEICGENKENYILEEEW